MHHSLTVPAERPAITPLPLGGTSPSGQVLAANSAYLTLDGQPWLPVMGEFHFSRYPRAEWETELRKMRAGAITVAATYLFWIHHEEIEGQFDWSGGKDLRHFVELCAQVGLYAYPRVGPWAHGECRNGGFPDWLVQRCGGGLRKNSQPYLEYARRFYAQIARQLAGLLWQDGGPVIGFQIENELLDNAPHLQTLLALAQAAGLRAPLYTMTGWGPADVPPGGQLIPVFGGYPDAFWERQTSTWARDSRKHFFYTHLRDDNTIGADLNRRDSAGDLSHLGQFPFGTCELGGGMQIAYHRRPWIDPQDVAAIAQVKIGCGSNLQGYYMYHGGAHPTGQHSTLQESQATGYWNDVPAINYDFQAPLGQYGQARPHYHALRLLHGFLRETGAALATMPMHLPDLTPSGLDDADRLRWALRSDGQRGFLFFNNYQRAEPLPAHPAVQFAIHLPGEDLLLPAEPVQISSGASGIWPVNLDLEGALLRYATAQLACRVTAAGLPVYVFVALPGIAPEFAFAANTLQAADGPAAPEQRAGQALLRGFQPGCACFFTLHSAGGQRAGLLVLDPAQAGRVWKLDFAGQERLLLCSESLYVKDGRLQVEMAAPATLELAVYPPLDALALDGVPLDGAPLGAAPLDGAPLPAARDGLFARFTLAVPAALALADLPQPRLLRAAGPARNVPVGPLGVAQAPETADFEQAAAWQIDLPAGLWARLEQTPTSRLFLRLHYAGDVARLLAGDRLLDDQFYYGAPWEIELGRFRAAAGQPLVIQVLPLRRDAPIYLPEERWPEFHGADAVAEIQRLVWQETRLLALQAG